MARHRDDLHFSNNRRRKLELIFMSFFRINDGRKRDVYVKGPAGDQVLHRACVVTRTAGRRL